MVPFTLALNDPNNNTNASATVASGSKDDDDYLAARRAVKDAVQMRATLRWRLGWLVYLMYGSLAACFGVLLIRRYVVEALLFLHITELLLRAQDEKLRNAN
jgi:hypothetical protein